MWLLCGFLTLTGFHTVTAVNIMHHLGLEPVGGAARVDKPQNMQVLVSSPWVQVPYPGELSST